MAQVLHQPEWSLLETKCQLTAEFEVCRRPDGSVENVNRLGEENPQQTITNPRRCIRLDFDVLSR